MTVQSVHPAGETDTVRPLSSVSSPVQTFTVATAARECGVVEKTIRRKLEQLEQHGAQRSEDGQWVIPWAALRAIGLRPGKPAGPDKSTGQPSVTRGLDQDPVQDETPELRRLLDISELRLQVAEAERDGFRATAEAERKRADDLAYVIRHQLTTSSASAVETSDVQPDTKQTVVQQPVPPPPPASVAEQQPAPASAPESMHTSGTTVSSTSTAKLSRLPKWLRRR